MELYRGKLVELKVRRQLRSSTLPIQQMRYHPVLALASLSLAFVGCGRKEEAPSAANVAEVVCSYAPSQSKQVLAISAAAGGASAGAAAVAAASGLTAVAHSSGAVIFTGASGYVAGTLGAAALVPLAVTVGAMAGGAAVTVELACAPKNHPHLVATVEVLAEKVTSSLK